MTEKEINEGNKAIAGFMGARIGNGGNKKHPVYINVPITHSGRTQPWTTSSKDLRYHTSWDWLMPAWNKFHNLEYTSPFPVGHLRICEHISNAIRSCDIELAFKELVEGITWHNQTTTDKGRGE